MPADLHEHQAEMMLKPPRYGCKTWGTNMLPSSCWKFSKMATIMRGTAHAVPFSVCANLVGVFFCGLSVALCTGLQQHAAVKHSTRNSKHFSKGPPLNPYPKHSQVHDAFFLSCLEKWPLYCLSRNVGCTASGRST